MKKALLYLFIPFLALLNSGFAQTNITLNIHHKLGDEDFALSTVTTNNMGSTYDFTRLEYYVAEISLVHDGGQETPVTDLYLLVDASEETSVELGDFPIDQLEAIRFHVGVDEASNHNDPTLYHSSHPLAPQWPSMHWGWAFGYRFAALEGNSGSNLAQIWQIHALENENYFQTEVALNLAAADNAIAIDLDADYTRALENIDLDSGPIVHGGYGEAKETLRNFQSYVFSPSGLVSSTEQVSSVQDLQIFPNPAPVGSNVQLQIQSETATGTYSVRVSNAQGQQVLFLPQLPANTSQSLPPLPAGIYLLTIEEKGQLISSRKLVVQ